MKVGQFDDRAVVDRQRVERTQELRVHLASLRLALRVGADRGAFVQRLVLDRLVVPLQGLESLSIGDRENPGRDLAAAVEPVGAVPDHQHRVVQHFFDEAAPARHAIEKARQPRVVRAVELLERPQIARGNAADQASFRRLARIERRRLRLATIVSTVKHPLLPLER